mgnify:CR=1 FL=1
MGGGPHDDLPPLRGPGVVLERRRPAENSVPVRAVAAMMTPERLAEITQNHLHRVDGKAKPCPGKFGDERGDICDLLAALREAQEKVCLIHGTEWATGCRVCATVKTWDTKFCDLANENDALEERVEALEKALAWTLGALGDPPRFTGLLSDWEDAKAALCGVAR